MSLDFPSYSSKSSFLRKKILCLPTYCLPMVSYFMLLPINFPPLFFISALSLRVAKAIPFPSVLSTEKQIEKYLGLQMHGTGTEENPVVK